MGISEDLLKEFILSKYKSVREFTQDVNMPYSTVDSIFKRGIRNASVDNVLLICNHLHISADALVEGRIEPSRPSLNGVRFDEAEYTPAELDRIKEFAAFVKSNRKGDDEENLA
jgi:hypothetical protein